MNAGHKPSAGELAWHLRPGHVDFANQLTSRLATGRRSNNRALHPKSAGVNRAACRRYRSLIVAEHH